MTLFQRIAARLAEEDLGFDDGPMEDTLVTALPGVNGSFVVAARVRELDKRLLFYAFAADNTVEAQRGAMMELVTRANYGMIVGGFELDLEDGEVRFRVAIDLEGVDPVEPLVMTHLMACVATFDQYLPAIEAVQRGEASVAEALEAVERPGAADDDEDDDDA